MRKKGTELPAKVQDEMAQIFDQRETPSSLKDWQDTRDFEIYYHPEDTFPVLKVVIQEVLTIEGRAPRTSNEN